MQFIGGTKVAFNLYSHAAVTGATERILNMPFILAQAKAKQTKRSQTHATRPAHTYYNSILVYSVLI